METSPTQTMALTESAQAKDLETGSPKNVSVLSFLWDEEERRSIKKPREEVVATPASERRNSLRLGRKMGDKVAILLRSVDKDLREIRRLVAENPNTKKEIKSLVKALSSTVSQLCTREVLDNLEGQEETRSEVIIIEETADAATQTDRSGDLEEGAKAGPATASIATQTDKDKTHTKVAEVQTDPGEIPFPQRDGEYGPVRSLDSYDIMADWRRIVRRRWRQEAYVQTEVKDSRNILETRNSVPKVIFVTEETYVQLETEVGKRFPELLVIEDDYAVLEQTTRIKADNSKTASCKVIRIITDGTEENLWKNLTKVREETALEERVAFLPLLGKTNALLRKMVECILHDTDTYARLYIGPKDESAKKVARQVPKREPRVKDTCALVVEGTKKETYTEILRQVKDKVGSSTAGNRIRGLRSTRDGRLLITMDRDEVAAGRVQEILGEAGETLKVTKAGERKREVILHVRGMDALTSKQDVILAVETLTGPLRGRGCKLSELRPNMGNTLAATLTMDIEDADKLLAKGQIRIGCVNCLVEKRVNVARCYKCWDYTHKAKECRSSVDMSGRCYKCGEEGHNAKGCNKDEFCPICDRDGHKADTAKCPAYRRALRDAKDKERMRREKSGGKQANTVPANAAEEGATVSVSPTTIRPEEEVDGHIEQSTGCGSSRSRSPSDSGPSWGARGDGGRPGAR